MFALSHRLDDCSERKQFYLTINTNHSNRINNRFFYRKFSISSDVSQWSVNKTICRIFRYGKGRQTASNWQDNKLDASCRRKNKCRAFTSLFTLAVKSFAPTITIIFLFLIKLQVSVFDNALNDCTKKIIKERFSRTILFVRTSPHSYKSEEN